MLARFKPIQTHARKSFIADMNRKWEQKYKQEQAWLEEVEGTSAHDLPEALRGLMY